MAPRCPICDGSTFQTLRKYHLCASNDDMALEDIRQCETCDAVYGFPLPSEFELENFYARGAYWKQPVMPGVNQYYHSLGMSIARINWLKDKKQEITTVLDVGAGFGQQAKAFSLTDHYSLSKYAFVELDESASRAIIATRHSFNCERSGIPSKDQFDLLMLSQVLEHVSEPSRFLRQIKTSLCLDGIMYLEVPYRDDLSKKDVFPHLFFFSPQSLKRVLDDVGLKITHMETFGRKPESTFRRRVFSFIYRIASFLRFSSLSILADRKLWGYECRGGELWIRAIAKKLR